MCTIRDMMVESTNYLFNMVHPEYSSKCICVVCMYYVCFLFVFVCMYVCFLFILVCMYVYVCMYVCFLFMPVCMCYTEQWILLTARANYPGGCDFEIGSHGMTLHICTLPCLLLTIMPSLSFALYILLVCGVSLSMLSTVTYVCMCVCM